MVDQSKQRGVLCHIGFVKNKSLSSAGVDTASKFKGAISVIKSHCGFTTAKRDEVYFTTLL